MRDTKTIEMFNKKLEKKLKRMEYPFGSVQIQKTFMIDYYNQKIKGLCLIIII